MKLKRLSPFLMSLFSLFLFVLPSFALETKSSALISSYNITVTPSSNVLSIKFSVSGNVIMDQLGCESIEVYEKSGSRWSLTESLDENDASMSTSNDRKYINTIYCDSEPGVEYKVVVTIFAENSAGRDTRTQTKYVTGA